MPAKTPGESAKREAAIIAPPSPSPPISISVTISTIIEIGSATCSPVRICGNAAGRMISPQQLALAGAEAARRPQQVLVDALGGRPSSRSITGKIALNTTIEIFETS